MTGRASGPQNTCATYVTYPQRFSARTNEGRKLRGLGKPGSSADTTEEGRMSWDDTPYLNYILKTKPKISC